MHPLQGPQRVCADGALVGVHQQHPHSRDSRRRRHGESDPRRARLHEEPDRDLETDAKADDCQLHVLPRRLLQSRLLHRGSQESAGGLQQGVDRNDKHGRMEDEHLIPTLNEYFRRRVGNSVLVLPVGFSPLLSATSMWRSTSKRRQSEPWTRWWETSELRWTWSWKASSGWTTRLEFAPGRNFAQWGSTSVTQRSCFKFIFWKKFTRQALLESYQRHAFLWPPISIQDLEVSPEKHFENGIEVGKWSTTYVWSKIREKIDKTDWKRHDQPAIVNAFYSPLENSIQFPAGILQGNFFGAARPAYMNYGAIGWVTSFCLH